MKKNIFDLTNKEPFRSSQLELIEKFGEREGKAIWRSLTEAYMEQFNDPDTGRGLWQTWMERVIDGEPLPYVTRQAWFYGLKLYVDRSVLIPRPETEELVLWANQWIREKGLRTGVAIDWGTGSGCIALALKARNPDWTVIARELSREAVTVASRNSQQLDLTLQIEWCDILKSNDIRKRVKADLILSNPPYISVGEREVMSDQVLKHEPFMALFAPKPDPLLFYKALADRAEEELKDTGVMLLEINEFRGNATALVFEERGWYTRMEKDLSGKNRMLMVSRSSEHLVNYQLV